MTDPSFSLCGKKENRPLSCLWELRAIVEAGIVWQGHPESGERVPPASVLYRYKQWLGDFGSFWASHKKALKSLLVRVDWPLLAADWSSGGCAIAAEAIRRWLAAHHYHIGLALAEFGEVYLSDMHLYAHLYVASNEKRLIDTKGIYSYLQAYKGYSTPCLISDARGIPTNLVFDETFCQQITEALDNRFGSCTPLQRMIQNAWTDEIDDYNERSSEENVSK